MEETSHSNEEESKSKSKPISSSVVKRIASVFRSVVKSKSLFSIFDKISQFSKKLQYSNTLVALIRSRQSTKIHMVEDQLNEQQYLIDYYGGEQGEVEEENNDNDNENDYRYPDLTHSLFEEEMEEEEEEDDPNESVIDIVMNEKAAEEEKNGGEGEFKLEDEIDRVADLFITKFHKQLRIQKLNSFKRYQEMLNRSV